MKLDNWTTNVDLGESDAEVIVGGISAENWGIIFNSLLNYSRPIDSIVREITSNCFDSHQEARILQGASIERVLELGYGEDAERVHAYFASWQERPVEVEMQRENRLTGTDAAIIFRDFGVGLSPERVRKIYAFLAASTKRFTNEMIGGFGIGSKSPLGYRDEFFVVTRWFGEKYYYLVRKGPRGLELDFFGSESTDEVNGTEVVVGIKEGDWNSFQKAVQEQLAYFPAIRFIGCYVEPGTVYRGEHFVYRTNSPFTEMHLAIEGVYYPLDWRAAGVKYNPIGYGSYNDRNYGVPIGLRFSLDEIGSAIMEKRENIQYTPEVKALIQEKLRLARAEIQRIHDEKWSGVRTMKDYVEALMTHQNQHSLQIAEDVVLPRVNELIKVEPRFPKYHALPKLPKDPFLHWSIHREVREGRNDKQSRYTGSTLDALRKDVLIYIAPEGSMDFKKSGFIYWTTKRDFATIKRKPNEVRTFREAFGVSPYRDTYDKLIAQFLEEASEYLLSRYEHYDDVVVTEEYEAVLKAERDREAEERVKEKRRKAERVTLRKVEVQDNQNRADWLTFTMDEWNIGKIEAYRGLVVYGHQDDAEKMKLIAPIFFHNKELVNWQKRYGEPYTLDPKKVYLTKIAKTAARHFEANPNAMHVDTFIKSKSPVIRRFVTAKKILKMIGEGRLRGYERLLVPEARALAPDAHKLAVFVKKYIDTYAAEDYWSGGWRNRGRNLVEACLDLFKEEDLFETDVLRKVEELEAFLTKYPLLRDVDLRTTNHEELAFYMKAKGHVNPWLYYRFTQWKEKRERELLDLSHSGDGCAGAEEVYATVDTSCLH